MRTSSLCLVTVLAMMLGFLLGRSWTVIPPTHNQTIQTGLTIEQIQPLSSLVTTRVEVADVVETTLGGYTGGIKVAILVKGDFLLGIDLSKARFEAVDREHRTATLVLPQPSVTSPRVDHSRTRVFGISTSGLWQILPTDEGKSVVINRAYGDAQRIVEGAAGEPALLERSRQ